MAATHQITTPLTYHANAVKAVDSHNDNNQSRFKENAGELSDLQARILEALKDAPKGMRSVRLMNAIRRKMSTDRFHNAINSLVYLRYIVRSDHKRHIYYSITLEGRAVLDELNEILIAIVHGREKDLS